MGPQPDEGAASADEGPRPLSVLLTGATDGIGRCAALRLARRGGLRLLLHGRDPAKGAALLAELAAAAPGGGPEAGAWSFHAADLSRLGDVRALAEEVAHSVTSLDVLINNAGAGPGPEGAGRREAPEGHEYILTVNTLAPYLLAEQLRPLLSKGLRPRVVHVASLGQAPFNLDDLDFRQGYCGLEAYRRSKLALIMLSFQQAARWEAHGISVHSLHPGTLLNTTMVREHWKEIRGEPEEGAEAIEHIALAEDIKGSGGFFDRKLPARALVEAYDASARQDLESIVREWTGLA